MIEHASKIESVLELEGLGCVIIPGIPQESVARVQVGDHVYILEVNACVDTIISGIQSIRANPRIKGVPIVLPKTIRKGDVAIGSMLYLVEDSPKDGTLEKSHLEINDPVRVRLNARNSTERYGKIERKVWHHKYQIWYYFIRDINGRMVSKRFTAADLIALP